MDIETTQGRKIVTAASGAWVVGMLLSAAIGITVLVTDSSVPVDLQGKQWMWLSASILSAVPLWAAGCLWNLRLTSRILSNMAELVLMAFGALQALHGLGQAMGYLTSRHSLFVLTGTFYNPGPYSGYLAAILPVALHRMLQTRNCSSLVVRLQHYLSLVVLMLICTVLPAGMSRAAWLASMVSCVYVAFWFYRQQVVDFVCKYRYAAIGIILMGMLAATGAYLFKRDSADGRLLLWKITSHAIASSPWGEENGRTFSALYGDAQERYFTGENYSESEAWVAGTPDFAFNEYLQTAAEQGVWVAVSLVAALLGLLAIAGIRRRLAGMGGCLVSLMIFACFSYPLHIPAIVSVWILTVTALFAEGLLMVKLKVVSGVILLLAVSAGMMAFVNVYSLYSARTQAVREWMPVRVLYHSGAFKIAAEEYGKLYSRMDWHNDFCFEYGKSLYRIHRHREAEEVLLKAMKVSSDPMILNLLGRNAQDSGAYEKAERYLIRSTRRLPNRTYPYYLLVKLYALPEYHHPEKLKRAAGKVLFSVPKVNSTAICEMHQEVRDILKKYGTRTEKNIHENP